MTAETTLPRRQPDPATVPLHQVNTPASGPIPTGAYRPVAQEPRAPRPGGSRRIKRLTETREIRIRTTHRRRKVLARGGVLAGFGLAMVVYPIMGNVVEYHSPVANVPGVVVGVSPTTAHALLGDGPHLIETTIDLPTVDQEAQAIAVASGDHPVVIEPSLPNCTQPAVLDNVNNGHLDASQLCQMWGKDVQMRADAAIALAQMNEQFKLSFGRDLCIRQGYRSYAGQVAIKATRGYFAASPGTSMHGFGLAFDLCSGDDKGAVKQWLVANAATFGFFNPDWAKFRVPEPWHWEYAPGVNATGHYGHSEWADGALEAGTSGPVQEPATYTDDSGSGGTDDETPTVVTKTTPDPTPTPQP